MVVHHLTALDLVVESEAEAGWQPIDTFPRDGTVVEVRDSALNVVKAFWKDDAMAIGVGSLDRPALGELVNWRYMSEEE